MYYKRFAQTLSKGKYYVRWRTTTCYVCVGLNMFHWEKQYRIVSYSLVQLRARDFPFFVDINKYLIIKCHGGNVTAAMATADATSTYNSIKLFKSNRPMCGSSEKEKWYRPHPWQLNELRINLNKLFAIIIIYLSSILPRRRRTLRFFFSAAPPHNTTICLPLCVVPPSPPRFDCSSLCKHVKLRNCCVICVPLCMCVGLDSMGCNDRSDEKDSLRGMKCDEKWHANDLSCI